MLEGVYLGTSQVELKKCEIRESSEFVSLVIEVGHVGDEGSMARVKFDADFKGINLQEDGLEGACWEGYEAIGTKILDGREVPNCVPISEEMEKIQMEKGINLADYPWDECIADQTERYGDEETAKRVCGYIKSEYGGGE